MGNPNSQSTTQRSLAEHTTSAPATQNSDPFNLDLQTLLSHSVVRLRELTQMQSAVAWALRPDGTPYVAAASFYGEPPQGPSDTEFATLATLETVNRLDATPELIEIGKRHKLSAAAVVSGSGNGVGAGARQIAGSRDGARPARTPLALLLVGPEPARPRVLASLGEAARRLEVPLAAALAAGRFRALDHEVQQLDRLAALGMLTAEIAHEVRNPLVSIKTFLQLLPERGNDPEFTNSFLALVNDELRRMERLLDGIIQHAQPAGETDVTGASLDDAMTSALALVRHRSDKRVVKLDCADLTQLPRVALDADALRQVVLNLLLNAIEATPSGAGVHVSATSDADCVTFRIGDEGPGIPPELREEIFTAFFSTRGERSGGLGLAITRRIVTEAGGSISAGANEFGGAQFSVCVPTVSRERTSGEDRSGV